MALEVERKYPFSDFAELRTRLRDARAEYRGRFFEENLVLDTPPRELWQGGRLLRLRIEGDKAKLCLKRQPEASKLDEGYKIREEVETEVSQPEQMRQILEGLGYEMAFCYEKLREVWRLGQLTICLDHLPFGRYAELEGDGDSIPRAVETLGLQDCDFTTQDYHHLHKLYCRQRGVQEHDSFVFSEQQKSRLKELASKGGGQ